MKDVRRWLAQNQSNVCSLGINHKQSWSFETVVPTLGVNYPPGVICDSLEGNAEPKPHCCYVSVVPNLFWCIPPFAHFGTFYSSPITQFFHSSPIKRVCRNIWSTNILFLIWLLPVTVWLIVRVRGLVLTAIRTMDFIEDNNLNNIGTKLLVK